MRYLVLGMHKSGTTALAETLHASGVDMGRFDAAVTYDQGNHYEREETQQLNKQLLRCGNAHSLSIVEPLSPEDASPALLGKMAATVRKLDEEHESWGFKDPRSCLTWEAWSQVLPAFKVIAIYRHPLEIWHRYIHSKNPWVRLRRLGRGWRAMRAWHVYNSQLLAFRGSTDAELLLLEYGRFMQQDDSIAKLGAFVGREMNDGRNPELHRAGRDSAILYRLVQFLGATLFRRDVEQLYRELECASGSTLAAQAASKETRSEASQR